MVLLRDQTWRNKYINGHSLHINPPEEYINLISDDYCIHFIHTGKCAGESIIKALKRDFKMRILQYHVFDAQASFSYNLDALINKNNNKHFIIIATRDPIKRWVSSFNWDLHRFVLMKNIKLEKSIFAEFKNIEMLAQGIFEEKKNAMRFGRFGHMGMGLSFYTSSEIQKKLPLDNTFVIRTEKINQDYKLILDKLKKFQIITAKNTKKQNLKGNLVQKSKDKFKDYYPEGTFKSLNFCKPEILDSIKRFLKDDYEAHNYCLDINSNK